ncbi:MAG: hypothetical protein P8163_07110 [Candidatus Thiodiazotropha sp.]
MKYSHLSCDLVPLAVDDTGEQITDRYQSHEKSHDKQLHSPDRSTRYRALLAMGRAGSQTPQKGAPTPVSRVTNTSNPVGRQ